MNVTVRIPDDLAARLVAKGGDLERRALEALALAEYQAGHLTRPELQRMLGLETQAELDGFLRTHGTNEGTTVTEREQQGDALVARFRAFRAGKTLGGLKPAELIREGRR
jgi:hypothetical protein